MSIGILPSHTRPEHLGDPYLGAWHVEDAFSQTLADEVMSEVYAKGEIEPIRDSSESATNQIFERMIVDFTREHQFKKLETLGRNLGAFAINSTMHLFPRVVDFRIDEAAVQIYPPGAKLALGWHRDHPNDKFFVISAILAGAGTIGFTEKTYEEAKAGVDDSEIIASIATKALDVVYFRANGLYEREDESDIRETHAVTKIEPGDPRFSVQFRMEVNAVDYGNIPVNATAPLRQNRAPLLKSRLGS